MIPFAIYKIEKTAIKPKTIIVPFAYKGSFILSLAINILTYFLKR
jgi:hypothetical protein